MAVQGIVTGRTNSEKGIVRTFRQMNETHRRLANQMLNAADFEATRNLPINKRLACDESGEYDKDAPRQAFNLASAPKYPKHLHHKINEDQYVVVRDADHEEQVMASGLYSSMPIEKRSAFKVSDAATSDLIQRELMAAQARTRDLEARLYELTQSQARTDQTSEVGTLRQVVADLMARVEALSKPVAVVSAAPVDDDDDDDDDDDTVKPAAVKGRRK